VVFGAYDTWTDEVLDNKSPKFCAKPAFMCAFVLLLLQWIALLLVSLFVCAGGVFVICCVKNLSSLISDDKTNISSFGGISLLQIMLAGVMIGYGESYKEDCNNGATNYLVTGGIIILCSNLMPVAILLVVYLALCDNVITKAESCSIKILLLINNLLPIIGIGVAIWVNWGHDIDQSVTPIPTQGSALVFGSYSSWTYNELYLASPAYCAKPPFMCALVLLILQWVSAPLLICLMCCTLCMGGILLCSDLESSH
jgi:hypothetical protein